MTGSGAVVVGVRRAASDDLDELAAMAATARATVEPQRGGAALLAADRRGEDLIAAMGSSAEAEAGVVVVGTLDDVAVGYLVMVATTLANDEQRAVVEELWVEPEARQVGVGAAMLAEALDWATGRGCSSVDALALPGDRATKNFFESHGLVARAIVAHRELDPT